MTSEQLSKHFRAMGARIKFRRLPAPRRISPRSEPPSFLLDVGRDRKGEFFDFALRDGSPGFELLQVRPAERHLLLLASRGRRYLCGHDERHWFIAAIVERVSTVQAARRALMPPGILEKVRSLPPGEVDNRKNPVFLRQGEWFFVPVRRTFPTSAIHRNEPLTRSTRSKPHICREVCREGGELVYRIAWKSGVFTEDEIAALRQKDPDILHGGFSTMIRNPDIYARGTVRHPDHSTIELKGWHRVYINSEITVGQTEVNFFD